MKNPLVGKTILVTGGTGSIGSEIVKDSLEKGAKKVVTFSRDEIKCFQIKNEKVDPRLEAVVGDIRDFQSIEQIFDQYDFDIVYHCAAMKHVVICEAFPLEAIKTNVVGTQNVVDIALRHNVTKFITISTDKAVNPSNVMGATKQIAERITLNANKVSGRARIFSCVRFGNVANSRGSVIPVFIDQLLNRKPLNVTNPEVTRFVMGISDAAKLVVNATFVAQGGEIFILKMKAFKLGDLLEVITGKIAPKLNIPADELKVNIIGLVEGEKLYEQLVNDVESSRTYDLKDMYVILPNNEVSANYESIKKINLTSYTSKDVEMVSKVEIEQLIMQHLNRVFPL